MTAQVVAILREGMLLVLLLAAPLLVAALMIAAAVGSLSSVIFMVLKKPAPTAGPQPLATTTPDAPNAITIDVTTTPGADLFLDDAPLGKGPYHGAYPRDGLAHRVKADEVGYIPRTEIVVFDKPSAKVDIQLNKQTPVVPPSLMPNPPNLGVAPRPTGTHVAPPPVTTDNNPFTAPMTTASGRKHPRTIDTSFGN